MKLGEVNTQNSIYQEFGMEKGLLFKAEKKGKNGNIPFVQKHTFLKFISDIIL